MFDISFQKLIYIYWKSKWYNCVPTFIFILITYVSLNKEIKYIFHYPWVSGLCDSYFKTLKTQIMHAMYSHFISSWYFIWYFVSKFSILIHILYIYRTWNDIDNILSFIWYVIKHMYKWIVDYLFKLFLKNFKLVKYSELIKRKCFTQHFCVVFLVTTYFPKVTEIL